MLLLTVSAELEHWQVDHPTEEQAGKVVSAIAAIIAAVEVLE